MKESNTYNKLVKQTLSDFKLILDSEDFDDITFTPEFDLRRMDFFNKVHAYIRDDHYMSKPDNIISISGLSPEETEQLRYFRMDLSRIIGGTLTNDKTINITTLCQMTTVFLEDFTQAELNRFKLIHPTIYRECYTKTLKTIDES